MSLLSWSPMAPCFQPRVLVTLGLQDSCFAPSLHCHIPDRQKKGTVTRKGGWIGIIRPQGRIEWLFSLGCLVPLSRFSLQARRQGRRTSPCSWENGARHGAPSQGPPKERIGQSGREGQEPSEDGLRYLPATAGQQVSPSRHRAHLSL